MLEGGDTEGSMARNLSAVTRWVPTLSGEELVPPHTAQPSCLHKVVKAPTPGHAQQAALRSKLPGHFSSQPTNIRCGFGEGGRVFLFCFVFLIGQYLNAEKDKS